MRRRQKRKMDDATGQFFTIVIRYGLLLSLAFTCLLVTQYFLGFEHSVRSEDGQLDAGNRGGWVGKAMFGFAIVLIIGFPLLAVQHAERVAVEPLSFGVAFLLAYGVFSLANLWDLVVFDYILVVKHRPRFIQGLPNTPYYTTMKPHLLGWLRGSIIGLITSLLAATIGP